MIEVQYTGDVLRRRIEQALEVVKDRQRRVVGVLNAAGIRYTVIGGHALQHWVAQVDVSIVRNTRDVEIILNEHDLARAIAALEAVGFRDRRSAGVVMFLDGPEAGARDAVHVVFAGRPVQEEDPEPVPDLVHLVEMAEAMTLPFEKLVKMNLTSFRRKYQVHLLDLISIGIVDSSWLGRFLPILQTRRQELLDDPEG